jgi:hypothetical protein
MQNLLSCRKGRANESTTGFARKLIIEDNVYQRVLVDLLCEQQSTRIPMYL